MRVSYKNVMSFLAVVGEDSTTALSLNMPLSCIGGIHLLGLKGCRIEGEEIVFCRNEPDEYNDVVILVGLIEEQGKLVEVCEIFRSTVEPGKYWPAKAMNERGAAHLTTGCHDYMLGKHKGKPALEPCSRTRVWRDLDGDFILDEKERIEVGNFGINVHAGGSSKIGTWSEGCVNICGGYDGEPWKRFMRIIQEHMSVKVIPLSIWGFRDFENFVLHIHYYDPFRPCVYAGTYGRWTLLIQQCLTNHGYKILCDGDWGPKTTAVLMEFKKQKKIPLRRELGIRVDRETWCALEGRSFGV